MSRRFTLVTLALTAVVAFLIGAIAAGGTVRSAAPPGAPVKPAPAPRAAARTSSAPAMASLVNFADVVEHLNPAVVNIDTTARASDGTRRSRGAVPGSPEPFDGPFDFGTPRERETPRRGSGSGFIIDAD